MHSPPHTQPYTVVCSMCAYICACAHTKFAIRATRCGTPMAAYAPRHAFPVVANEPCRSVACVCAVWYQPTLPNQLRTHLLTYGRPAFLRVRCKNNNSNNIFFLSGSRVLLESGREALEWKGQMISAELLQYEH